MIYDFQNDEVVDQDTARQLGSWCINYSTALTLRECLYCLGNNLEGTACSFSPS